MHDFDPTSVIASRQLSGPNRVPVVLSFGALRPMPDMPSDWYCAYRIDNLEDQAITGYALGIDAVQALYLAMIKAGQTLTDRPESLTFHDMPTFGLPRIIDQLSPIATAAAVEVAEDLGEMADPALTPEAKARFEALLEEYRRRLIGSLANLTEDEARRSLVPSRTTLLGLVKHLTYVETFYFVHRVTGQSLKDLGVASTPDRSFVLTDDDTIASVSAAYQRACAVSQDAGRSRARAGTDDYRGSRPHHGQYGDPRGRRHRFRTHCANRN